MDGQQEQRKSEIEDVSSAKAVLLGAFAPGVNGPTWNTLKFILLVLGLCLIAMLALAFTRSDIALILHIGFLVLIALVLFFLMSRFLEETGLVSIEHQMQEMGLMPKDCKETSKKS
ncbi:hypothetical protein Nepgr_017673 [Nepenthes gracilis]|uniref:Uncharacterized protein n=1 Tax=Nepenthes gracilis TaxID=150966 RepID=A0AAD3SRJ1_NEPGR|nr:hypothetical protein Nepgr_017673 [Nepenthes gracilis]